MVVNVTNTTMVNVTAAQAIESFTPIQCQDFRYFINVFSVAGVNFQGNGNVLAFSSSNNSPASTIVANSLYSDLTGISTNNMSFTLTPSPQLPAEINTHITQAYGLKADSIIPFPIKFADILVDNAITVTSETFELPGQNQTTDSATTNVALCSVITDSIFFVPWPVGLSKSASESNLEHAVGTFGAVCRANDFGFIRNQNFAGDNSSYSFDLRIGPDDANCQVYLCSATAYYADPDDADVSWGFTMERLNNLGNYLLQCNTPVEQF